MRTVTDILKAKGRAFWSISRTATVLEALKLMSEKHVGALMVGDRKGNVAGIISERVYARKVIFLERSPRDTRVEEIMTPAAEMITIEPSNTAEDCLALMSAGHVRHLPVREGPRYVGLVSMGDVVKAVLSEKDGLIEQLSNYIAGKYL